MLENILKAMRGEALAIVTLLLAFGSAMHFQQDKYDAMAKEQYLEIADVSTHALVNEGWFWLEYHSSGQVAISSSNITIATVKGQTGSKFYIKKHSPLAGQPSAYETLRESNTNKWVKVTNEGNSLVDDEKDATQFNVLSVGSQYVFQYVDPNASLQLGVSSEPQGLQLKLTNSTNQFFRLIPTFQMQIVQGLRIRTLTKAEIEAGGKGSKQEREFKPEVLMSHWLFKEYKPILFGGAALSLHTYSHFHRKLSNRVIDDLDFYVADAEDYFKIKAMREISRHNWEEKRFHFYERIAEDCYISITICHKPNWKTRSYRPIEGIHVLTLPELDNTKLITEEFNTEICEELVVDRKRYFLRKDKLQQDRFDIFQINALLSMHPH